MAKDSLLHILLDILLAANTSTTEFLIKAHKGPTTITKSRVADYDEVKRVLTSKAVISFAAAYLEDDKAEKTKTYSRVTTTSS